MLETDVMATLVLRIPPERIEQVRSVVKDKMYLARINADDYENRKELRQAGYWRKEEAFWKSIWEQLNQ